MPILKNIEITTLSIHLKFSALNIFKSKPLLSIQIPQTSSNKHIHQPINIHYAHSSSN